MRIIGSSLILALTTSFFVHAQNPTLGEPSYNGSGCPRGSASAALSPDFSALTILFDSYAAAAGGATRKSMDRKTCNIAVPVNVPQGKSVTLFTIDYRGFNSIPRGAYATFNAEYFFAGASGPAFEKRWDGREEDSYILRNELAAEALVWSSCGDSVILRANTAIMARTNRNNEDVYTAVDTIDISAGLIYHLRWKDC